MHLQLHIVLPALAVGDEHGPEVDTRILPAGGEVFDAVLVDAADLCTLRGEVELWVAGVLRLGLPAAAHCSKMLLGIEDEVGFVGVRTGAAVVIVRAGEE